MKLPVPTEIRCGSHTYQVVCNEEETQRLKDEGNNGDVNWRTCKVAISLARPIPERTEALIHEALHIANKVFRGTHADELSEERIGLLSEGLAQILQGWGIEFDWDGEKRKVASSKLPAAVALGHLLGRAGGLARARKLTPEQRKDIAKKAADARWHKEGKDAEKV